MKTSPFTTRRVLAAAAVTAALATAVPAAPASAYVCGGIRYCVPPQCHEVWGAIVCIP